MTDRVPSVELLFGERWTGDVEYLLRLANQANEPHPDLRCVRDVIDIVVGGDNLTAGLGEDGIFCLLADLIAGLDDLLAGRRRKVIVDFREAPWELALVARGPHLALSLYSILPGEAVGVHDRLAPVRHVTDAVVAAADRLGAELDRIRPGLSAHPLMALPQRVRACAREVETDCRQPSRPDPCVVTQGTLEVTLDLSHGALLDYVGADFDLHALLCGGSVRWLGDGDPVALEGARPLQIVRGLVADLRDVVEALGGGRPRPVRRRRRAMLLEGFSVVAGQVALLPAGMFVRPGPSDAPDGAIILPARTVVSAVVEAVEAVVRSLSEVNAELLRNERVAALVRDASGLGAWYEELASDLRPACDDLDGAEGRLEIWTAEAPKPGVPARFTFAQMRTVRLRHRWSVAGALRVASARRVEDAVIVPEDGSLASYHLASGEALWRRRSDDVGPPTIWLSGNAVLHASDGRLRALDVADGGGWARSVSVGGRCEGGARLAAPGAGALVLACEGGVAAVADADGAPQWSVPLRHGQAVGCGAEGRHFVVGSDRGFVYGIDAVRGETLWRSHVGARAARPYLRPGAPLIVASADPPQLTRLHPRTGARVWSVPLDRPPLGVLFAGGLALVLTSSGLAAYQTACGARQWTREGVVGLVGDTWPSAAPFLALTAAGILCFDLLTGEVRWSVARPVGLAVPAGDGAVVVAGPEGVAVLCADTGRAMHELEGLPPSPAYLHVGADNLILVGELEEDSDEGRLSCFEPEFFLALLR